MDILVTSTMTSEGHFPSVECLAVYIRNERFISEKLKAKLAAISVASTYTTEYLHYNFFYQIEKQTITDSPLWDITCTFIHAKYYSKSVHEYK